MNKRVSPGDIIFLSVNLTVLIVLLWFFSPPKTFVLSCMAVGAMTPILQRIVRRLLPKAHWTLPLVLVVGFIIFLHDRYYPGPIEKYFGLSILAFGSSFAVALCVV